MDPLVNFATDVVLSRLQMLQRDLLAVMKKVENRRKALYTTIHCKSFLSCSKLEETFSTMSDREKWMWRLQMTKLLLFNPDKDLFGWSHIAANTLQIIATLETLKVAPERVQQWTMISIRSLCLICQKKDWKLYSLTQDQSQTNETRSDWWCIRNLSTSWPSRRPG